VARLAGPDGRPIDQISRTIDLIRRNPDSRRIVVNAWNVGELEQMSLTPCHALFQFWVGDGKLSCQLYQRSADVFLGVPFNIASYALLTHMFAQQCDLAAGDFIWTGGDCTSTSTTSTRPTSNCSAHRCRLPRLAIKRKPPSIFEYEFGDFQLLNYQAHPSIKAPIASSRSMPTKRSRKQERGKRARPEKGSRAERSDSLRAAAGGDARLGHPRPRRVCDAGDQEGHAHHRIPRRAHHARRGRPALRAQGR
jgi:hypothetical protein